MTGTKITAREFLPGVCEGSESAPYFLDGLVVP
jgi:hypothetical protein